MFLSAGARITGGMAARRAFPAGTQLPFIQAVAPVGWVRVSTFDDAALRIVGSATPGSGGTNGFSTVMAQTTVGNTTLTTAQIPSHSHGMSAYWFQSGGASGSVFNPLVPNGQSSSAGGASNTDSAGSGGSHNHTITMSMKFVDALIGKKS